MPRSKSDEATIVPKLIRVWASRFYRRPGSNSEVERLVEIFQAAG
ncbi:MAG: hypothetical protein R3C03_16805 [Pirellulaceae bacterium]